MRRQKARMGLLFIAVAVAIFALVFSLYAPRCPEPFQRWPTNDATEWTRCGYAAKR